MPGLASDERAAIYDSANETLARLHLVDYEALGLGEYGRPGNYFARQISRWSGQYEASRTRDIPEMDKLIAWLPGAVPKVSDRTTIIHGDYSFHNLLIHPTEPRVAAVIDWELSTLGDPVGDLTYHMMEWFRPEGVDVRGTLRGVAHRHGTLATSVLGAARKPEDLGEAFGNGLTAAEIDYFVGTEWARTGEDVLWRRSKCGLRMAQAARERVTAYVAKAAAGLR